MLLLLSEKSMILSSEKLYAVRKKEIKIIKLNVFEGKPGLHQHYAFGNIGKPPKTCSDGILQIIPNRQVRD
jgi:hypothetical protein